MMISSLPRSVQLYGADTYSKRQLRHNTVSGCVNPLGGVTRSRISAWEAARQERLTFGNIKIV